MTLLFSARTLGMPLLLLLLTTSTAVHGQDDNTLLDGGGSITYGDENTLIGHSAGESLTTGSENVFVGARAGAATTTISGQVFVGHAAGASCDTSCAENTLVGYLAGTALETARYNVMVGDEAGVDCVDCESNTFVGQKSGHACTTCDDNTFVGFEAGHLLQTGEENTGVGDRALNDLTTGNHNTAAGRWSLYDLLTGNGNAGHGAYAGGDLGPAYSGEGTASCNSMFGLSAGTNTENPSFNTFFGALSGCDNNRENGADGKSNTYIGTACGGKLRNANFNSIVGAFADGNSYTETQTLTWCQDPYDLGCPVTGLTGDYENMAAVGANAEVKAKQVVLTGAESSVTANSGIAIGYQATVSSQNSVAIGAGTQVSQGSTIALGGDDSSGTPMTVGIGNTSPNSLASLDLGATDKGLLPNRMTTTERSTLGSSLTATEAGLVVFDSDEHALYVWNGSTLSWVDLSSKATGPGVGTDTPSDKASLDLGATDKGLMLNRMTSNQRITLGLNTLTAAENGMLIYDTDEKVVYIWNGNRLWWDEYSPRRTYRYTIQASVKDLASTPAIYYGGGTTTVGVLMYEDASVSSFSVVLDANLASGSLTFDVAINGVAQNQELQLNSGRTGILDFSPPISFSRGDLLEVTVSGSGISGASTGGITVVIESNKEESQSAPTIAPSQAPSGGPTLAL